MGRSESPSRYPLPSREGDLKTLSPSGRGEGEGECEIKILYEKLAYMGSAPDRKWPASVPVNLSSPA